MDRKIACVYALIFTTQQGIHHFYVGQTIDYKRRISEHLAKRTRHSNHRVATAFKRFGEPTTVILQTEADPQRRIELENLFIEDLKATLNLKRKGRYGVEYCVEGETVDFNDYMAYELCNDWNCP